MIRNKPCETKKYLRTKYTNAPSNKFEASIFILIKIYYFHITLHFFFQKIKTVQFAYNCHTTYKLDIQIKLIIFKCLYIILTTVYEK